MAEQEKNYLDLEPTAAQIKKSIEEIVEKLTENVVENKDKIFTLEVDTGNIPQNFDGALTDDMLDKVKIRLQTVSAISPVEGKIGQMIMSDGNNWIEKSEFYTSLFSTTENSEEGWYTEVRFGPDLIGNPNIQGRSISRLVLSGNPLSLKDETSNLTVQAERIKQADGKTFKMVIAGTAKATFKNNSNFSVDSKGLHFAADNSNWNVNRFTLTGGANMDVTGDASGSPQVYIHGKCILNLDSGYDPYSKKNNYTGNNAVISSLEGATIAIHDKAMLAMSEGAYLTASDMAKVYFEGNSIFKTADNAEAYFEKDSKLWMQGGHIVMNAGTLLFSPEYYKPCICMNGGGQIVFNAYNSTFPDTPDTGYDPYLIANPTSFIFLGQGSSGSKTNALGTQNPSSPISEFWGPSSLKPARRNPQIQIADETMIIIDAAAGGGSNYLKIGACGGGQTQTHILDNTHLELRQNSIISLRGKYQDSENGPIGDFPITRQYGSPDGTGSMLTMYDNAVFIMRSEWPEYQTSDYSGKKDHRGGDLSETTWKTDLDFWKRDGSPLFGMVGNSVLKLQNAAIIDMNTGSSINMNSGASITMNASSINLNNGKIAVNEQGITFEQGENSITFTFSELEQLKALITPTDINNRYVSDAIECANATNHSIVNSPNFENLEV